MYATEKKEEKKEIKDDYNLLITSKDDKSSKVDEQNQTKNELIEEKKNEFIE